MAGTCLGAKESRQDLCSPCVSARNLLTPTNPLGSGVAYNVAQRTREMSVRMALGARGRHLLELVVGEAARVVIAGLVLGVIAALYASRRIAVLLFHVAPWDRSVFGVVLVVLLAVGLMAALVPALRTLRIDPIDALKQE